MGTYRLGIDIGGTFTDFSLLDEGTGLLQVLKTPSTREQPALAVFEGTRRLLTEQHIEPQEIAYFIHGTTLAVNTVIERTGARSALLITKGFQDVLNIGRHRIPDIFNFLTELPAPLIPRSRVIEIPERCIGDGRVAQPADEETMRAAARRLAVDGVSALAVCFLHSYKNPANELKARQAIEEAAPGLYVSLSCELWPQMREYERALVAVINAYIGQKMAAYFEDLESGLREIGLRAPVLTTKSNGGVMNAREAGQRPVETLLSGPAAGVMGASFVARAAGFERIITVDMGGTSADVAVVDGEPRYSTENQVGDFPLFMPAIDVSSIGAGGGSIAWTDSHGVLKVGPRSAGANPGPACYALGGTEPTVTDAYVSLGIIHPSKLLAGSLRLDRGLAWGALEQLGRSLGLGVPETAESILRVATSQMYATLVPLMARKGINLDDFTLFAFGGAGPTHGFLLAREVGIRRVIIPRHPGVLCSTGSLVADVKRDFVRTLHLPLRRAQESALMEVVRQSFCSLAAEGHEWLMAQRLPFLATEIRATVDLRYLGQSFDLTIPVTAAELADATGQALRQAFHTHYSQVYGYADEQADLEILNLRTSAIGVTPKPRPTTAAPPAGAPAEGTRGASREIFHDGSVESAFVLEREALRPNDRFKGPTIVEQYDTTTFIPRGFDVTVDEFGNLIGDLR